ncbi:MAG: type II toxin-antitoxin system RelE family toxin [Bryobacteraceae bacterium]
MPYFTWMPAARTALRKIDRAQAQEILIALTQYAGTRQGDVTALTGEPAGRLRLRCGDYRVIFRLTGSDRFEVLKVGHRREVYRD